MVLIVTHMNKYRTKLILIPLAYAPPAGDWTLQSLTQPCLTLPLLSAVNDSVKQEGSDLCPVIYSKKGTLKVSKNLIFLIIHHRTQESYFLDHWDVQKQLHEGQASASRGLQAHQQSTSYQ